MRGLIDTDTLNGPGSVIRTKILKKTVYQIQNFFGPEDMDLSIRLKNMEKLVNLDSIIYHEVAKSASLTGQEIRKYYEIKSYLYFLKKLGFNYYFF